MDPADIMLPDPDAIAGTPDAATGEDRASTWNADPGETVSDEAARDTMAGAMQFQDETHHPPAPEPGRASASAQTFEFAQHSLLSIHEARQLRADYEEFLSALGFRLAVYFRMEFELTLASLTTPTYCQFVSGLTRPTHLTLFKVEPLRGIGVLEISLGLGLAMTDRLMGGSGEILAETRLLSEIEVTLLDQVAQFITEGWCAQWPGQQELKPALLGHESDAAYLHTSPPESPTLLATINARLGQCSGQLQLAFPMAALKTLLPKSRAEFKLAAGTEAEPLSPNHGPWHFALNDVTIVLAAELTGPQLPARTFLTLKVGDMVEMPADSVNLVQLRLGGLTRFTGRLGTRDNFWAVEVTHALKT